MRPIIASAGSALHRHEAALRAVGGAITGPPLVIYQGEVNEDSDGPVETRTPVDPTFAGSVDLPSRVEPAHREAGRPGGRYRIPARRPLVRSARYDSSGDPRKATVMKPRG